MNSLKQSVRHALGNAAVNGHTFEGWSAEAIALDMVCFDSDMEREDYKEIAAIIEDIRRYG